MNYSLNLRPNYGFTLIFIVSIILTLITYVIEHHKPIEPNRIADQWILTVRLIHYMSKLFSVMYLFVFDASIDIVYLLYSSLIYGHWLFFNNECILSYLETKYYRKNYIAGTDGRANLYLRILFSEHTRTIVLLSGLVAVTGFLIVLYRSEYIPDPYKHILSIMFVLYIIFIAALK